MSELEELRKENDELLKEIEERNNEIIKLISEINAMLKG